MKTSELLSTLKIKTVYGTLPDTVGAIYNDSREVSEDSLFICKRGYKVDGHDYYQEAVDKGAKVIVAEKPLEVDLKKIALVVVHDTKKAMAILGNKFYDYPSTKLQLLGVTGTNGKTTVASIIHWILKKTGEATGLSGTIGVDLDGKIIKSENTTPDTLINQKIMHQAYERNLQNMILEVSSHGLTQGRLWGMDFDIVAFTNLTHEHLDYHQSMEEYGHAKGLLFSQLGSDLSKQKTVVLNKDDSWFKHYNSISPYEVISFGLHTEADFKAIDIRYYPEKTTFTLLSPEGEYQVETLLLGEFNVYNILAAFGCLFAKGIPVDRLVALIKELPPTNGRMEKVDHPAPLSMYIDYAHTPDAIEKAIQSVLPFKKSRIVFLVGTGGDRDDSIRPHMAEKASVADYVVLTINDQRFEETDSILSSLKKGMKHDNYVAIADRKEAIKHAVEVSEPGDILILAGKGQEDYQIIEDKKYPHSDLEVLIKECDAKYGKNKDS